MFKHVMSAENPHHYEPQGFHPVHLGDTFNNGRYTVLHKLGHGASSTIWLVHDKQTDGYAALKVIAAWKSSAEAAVFAHLDSHFDANEEGSNHVARMLDHFFHDGPNGRHQCIVGEVYGPGLNLDAFWFWDSESFPANMVRRLFGQVALGVRYLHRRGVAHGDLHPGNVLLCLPMTWSSWEDIEKDIGAPRRKEYGASPSPHLPNYLVPSPLDGVDFLRRCLISPNVKICDFSESTIVGMTTPPPLASPYALRAPECLLGFSNHATLESDIWALAALCGMLFSGGGGLFMDYSVSLLSTSKPTKDAILQDMVRKLGEFPEPMRSSWASRGYVDNHAHRARPTLLWKGIVRAGEEYEALETLLRSMLRYEPTQRATAQDVVDSRWMEQFCRREMAPNNTFVVELLDEFKPSADSP
ncbi:Protein kinase [Mycena indigotica]|uniref:non-specific serine/threonine protein kinase n=1 Tax=Mycena indigotica TaxID=2126181 RepID=A0A8H6TGZ4_9AGAR|nr:Protein kinase [Mycena indigotica]KAF7316511.1 Protein kinase [Mycena indigotica]